MGEVMVTYFVEAASDDAPYRNYTEYLAHPHFRRIRSEAMKRAGWKCQRCGARATQVHHLRYPPWGTFDVVENLEPVCYRCHCLIHGKEK
jgi:hypothetical protein